MTHKTIQIEENAQHENESLVMMEREQGICSGTTTCFLNWLILPAAPVSIRSMI